MEDQLASLDRARRAYLSQIRQLIERQLSEINAAEQSPGPDMSHRDSSAGSAAGSPAWMGSLVKE
jgi:hypothetical protein